MNRDLNSRKTKSIDAMSPKMTEANVMDSRIDEHQSLIPGLSATSRRYYWVNMTGISLGILCLITGYSILFFIQSSLHAKDGLGSISMAVSFAVQVITCVFLPPFLMGKIGCKWSLVVSGLFIAVFIVANLQSSFAILIPASVCFGIGCAVLWATMNTVVSDLATGYASLVGSLKKDILARFFSIFFTAVNAASVLGNFVSSLILSPQDFTNVSVSLAQVVCGGQYCEIGWNSTLSPSPITEVPQSEVNNLVLAGLTSITLGIFFILVLLYSYNQKDQESTNSSLGNLLATIRLIRNPNMLLLIVCTFNSGLMFSFLSADFTKAFVTCSIGIQKVGLVVTSFGIVMTTGTIMLAYLAPLIPRIALFLGAVALNIIDLLLMLFWNPDPQAQTMLYVIAGIWGLTFSIWLSQLLALYGDVFVSNHKEAFSNHRTWNSLGFVIGFGWSYYLCMTTKIFIILGFLLIGTVCYLIVERRVSIGRLQTT